MAKYAVTGYVKRKGCRDTLTIPASKEVTQQRKARLEAELKDSIPKYQWCNNLRVKRVE